MRAFSIIGFSQSGKTTTVENIIKELKKRRYTVGTVKEIHFEDFAIDQEGTNTYRHKTAGAELVTARGQYETDILFPKKLSVDEILRFYEQEFVVMEGVRNANVPKIISAHNENEIEKNLDGSVFAISGKVSNFLKEYKGIPAISSIEDIEKLVDLIEEKVFEKLPEFPSKCCRACGYDCRELLRRILKGEEKRDACIISEENIKLFADGKEILMVPFVQNVLRNVVMGVVKELKGYRKGADIEIRIGGKD